MVLQVLTTHTWISTWITVEGFLSKDVFQELEKLLYFTLIVCLVFCSTKAQPCLVPNSAKFFGPKNKAG